MSKTTPEEAEKLAAKYGIYTEFGTRLGGLAALIDEVRGVDAEPVAMVHPKYSTELEQIVGKRLSFLVDPESLPIGTKLYTHPAPSQPVCCPICHEERAHTGTCGSNDPRALCNQAPSQPAAPVELPVVGALWEYIGKDPMGYRTRPCARSLHEMNPDKPPYQDTWRLVDKVVKLSDAQAAIAAAQKGAA